MKHLYAANSTTTVQDVSESFIIIQKSKNFQHNYFLSKTSNNILNVSIIFATMQYMNTNLNTC